MLLFIDVLLILFIRIPNGIKRIQTFFIRLHFTLIMLEKPGLIVLLSAWRRLILMTRFNSAALFFTDFLGPALYNLNGNVITHADAF